MKDSRRSRRMDRSHKRHKRGCALNLVSLMDIFTILVFFLLVNSSEGEVIPSTKSVVLPESISEQKPGQNLVIMVTDTHILVQGNQVASLKEITGSDSIASLQSALESEKAQLKENSDGITRTLEVTIMGNRDIPYKTLKKVMVTCTLAGFERISLAVLQKSAEQS